MERRLAPVAPAFHFDFHPTICISHAEPHSVTVPYQSKALLNLQPLAPERSLLYFCKSSARTTLSLPSPLGQASTRRGKGFKTWPSHCTDPTQQSFTKTTESVGSKSTAVTDGT